MNKRAFSILCCVLACMASASASETGLELYNKGDFVEAEKAFRLAVVRSSREQGTDHPETLAQMNNLANALTACGRPAEAEQKHREVLSMRERVLGLENLDTVSSRNNLATALYAQGKYGEAEKEYRAVLVVREHLLGLQHFEVLKTYFALALCIEAQGKPEESLEFLRKAETGWRITLGEDSAATLRARVAIIRIEESLVSNGSK